MKGLFTILLVPVLVFGLVCLSSGSEKADRAEIQELLKVTKELRQRIERLEKKLQQYEARERDVEEAKKEVSDLKEALGKLQFSADVTLVPQGTINNDDNAKARGGEGKDKLDAAWSIDFDVTTRIGDHGTGYILMEAGQGDGVNDEVDSLSGENDDAPGNTDPTMDVTEAWYEHEFLKVPAVATFGKVDLTNYFDTNEVANDETAQFLSSGFVNNLAVEFPDDNGLGFRLTVSPIEWLDLSAGIAEADADFEDIADDAFGIFEMGIKPEIRGHSGNYRIYAWINGINHWDTGDLKKMNSGTITPDEADNDKNNWGIGFSFDQEVVKGVTLFLRGGIMDSDIVRYNQDESEVETPPLDGALSGGFQLRGSLWGREYDRFGIAFGTVFVDDDLEGLYGLPVDMTDEHHLELYYALSFFEGGLEFSPDLQVIWNSGGDSDADTVTVGGVRMQVNF